MAAINLNLYDQWRNTTISADDKFYCTVCNDNQAVIKQAEAIFENIDKYRVPFDMDDVFKMFCVFPKDNPHLAKGPGPFIWNFSKDHRDLAIKRMDYRQDGGRDCLPNELCFTVSSFNFLKELTFWDDQKLTCSIKVEDIGAYSYIVRVDYDFFYPSPIQRANLAIQAGASAHREIEKLFLYILGMPNPWKLIYPNSKNLIIPIVFE